MIAPDVNVLVYAHREDSADHPAFLAWLEHLLASAEAFGLSDLVLSGFIRIVTHPAVFKKPSPLTAALQFAEQLRSSPNCVPLQPGPRHWEIFERLCRDARARGNLVQDAFLAAMAIESGCEWITTDRDYSRFPRLRSRHPLG